MTPAECITRYSGLDLRQFQVDWLEELSRERNGDRIYSQALWGVPRGNGTIRPKGRDRYAPATVGSYEKSVRLHLVPALGGVRLADLRRAEVQTLADELLADGLSPSSASNALDSLRALYRRLEDRDEIAYNPVRRIDLPPKKSLKPKRIATARRGGAPDRGAAARGPAAEGDGVLHWPSPRRAPSPPLLRRGSRGERDPRRARLGPG